MKRIVAEYFQQHPNLRNLIRGMAIAAAVCIVVCTIVEDFGTLGVGTVDDGPCFAIAYNIVRYAWAL